MWTTKHGETQKEINDKTESKLIEIIESSAYLFSQTDLTAMQGKRLFAKDGTGSWDIVSLGSGDFNYGGVGVKVVYGNGVISIAAFGAKSDYNETTKTGTPVDDAFNKLMSYCIATGAKALIVGKFYSKGGMKIPKPVKIQADAQIYCDNSSNSAALEIGVTGIQFSTSGSPIRLKLDGTLDIRKIRNVSGNPHWWGGLDTLSIGILEHSLVGCAFNGLSVDGFYKNRVWEASGSTGYANNKNYDCTCTNGFRNIQALVSNEGYVTENRFFGGLLTNTNQTPVSDAANVISLEFNSDGFACDNNMFIGVNIEDRTSAKVFQTNGQYNVLSMCRLEQIKSQAIHFKTGSLNNRVDQCLGIENGKSSVKVLDEGANNFSGVGTVFQNAYSSYGVYMGSNNTPATNGGLGKYSVFGAMNKSDTRYLAASLGQKGFGIWKPDATYSLFPTVWADSDTGYLKFGFGHTEPPISLRGRSDGVSLTLGSENGSLGMGGLVMGGNFDKGHLTLRSNGNDYHLWVDTSGNLRFSKTTQNTIPTTNTDGVIVATAT